jgi:hypothetical protein
MKKTEALEKLLNWFESQTTDDNQEESFELKSKHVHVIDSRFEVHLKCLTWKELLTIKAKSFSKNSEGNFFSTERQKKLVLQSAIEKIVDKSNQEIHDKNILDSLSYEAVEEIWNEYQSILHLSAEEVSLIYTSAQKYFNDASDEYYPVLPEILEIDYILKGLVSLTRNEFNSLSNKEFEMMQLVLAAKNEMSKKI